MDLRPIEFLEELIAEPGRFVLRGSPPPHGASERGVCWIKEADGRDVVIRKTGGVYSPVGLAGADLGGVRPGAPATSGRPRELRARHRLPAHAGQRAAVLLNGLSTGTSLCGHLGFGSPQGYDGEPC